MIILQRVCFILKKAVLRNYFNSAFGDVGGENLHGDDNLVVMGR